MLRLILIILPLSLHAEMVERVAIVTAYTPTIEGGGAGTYKTAVGVSTHSVPYGIAADPRLVPYGAVIKVPGYRETPDKDGPWWQVDDTGAALKHDADRGILHIDLRMRNPWAARQWGVRVLTITIYTEDS